MTTSVRRRVFDECSRRNSNRQPVTSSLSSRAEVQQAVLAEQEKPRSRTEVRERRAKARPSLRAGKPRRPQPQGSARSGRRGKQRGARGNTGVQGSLTPATITTVVGGAWWSVGRDSFVPRLEKGALGDSDERCRSWWAGWASTLSLPGTGLSKRFPSHQVTVESQTCPKARHSKAPKLLCN